MKFKFTLLFLSILPLFIWGQPTLKWWFDTNDASYGQSSAADIDGDGKMEVVFGCYRNDSSVYALNADDGTLLWKVNTHSPGVEGCNDAAPLLYDIDNDGIPEVIVASSCNPTTFCFDGLTGTLRWQRPMRGSDSPPSVADLNNDGVAEILYGEFDGYVMCIESDSGNMLWEIPVDLDSWIQTAPTIVDLDNDGHLDFVVGTWNNVQTDSNRVYANRGDNHSLLWSYPIGDVMYHGTAVADLDNDGLPELVIGAYNDTLYCINGDDGSTAWKFAASGGYIGDPATIGDIDNDGSCDVVFISSYKVYALTANGALKWQYTIPSFEQSFRGAALADINNDTYLDVVFGTTGGKVIALSGNNGSLIWSIDLATHYGNPDFEFDHAPLIADFDGDDSLDIFIVGGYGTYPNFQSDFGRAYMLNAGKGNGPDWLTFQQNEKRQLSLCEDSNVAIVYDDPKTEVQVFPNPADDKVNIIFTKNNSENLRFILFNCLGQIVLSGNTITNNFVIRHNNLSSGIYQLCVFLNNDCYKSKIIFN